MEEHTVRAYDSEIDELRLLVLKMGGLVVDQIALARRALKDRDDELARTVIEREQEVNRLDTEGEEMAFRLIAKRQPIASDLRTVLALMKTITDLERCGDEAKKIAKTARRLVVDEVERVPEFSRAIDRMSELAGSLLRSVIEALDNFDAEKAIRVAREDRHLNWEYKQGLRLVHETLTQDPSRVEHAAEIVIVLKALERIGDHAKNIAKYVVYVAQGRDVRHVKTKQLYKEIAGGEDEPPTGTERS
ncbi:MAG: phosphate signaling complex protein PhoU [Gammaproteobacteria bacterium]